MSVSGPSISVCGNCSGLPSENPQHWNFRFAPNSKYEVGAQGVMVGVGEGLVGGGGVGVEGGGEGVVRWV